MKPESIYDIAVIGGGAAGFFGAIQIAKLKAELRVIILEKTSKVLSKVRISGGGRCNVTHSCENSFELAKHYPRGHKALKNLFPQFDAMDMVEWLRQRGVQTHAEDDGRIFPITNRSQTIVDCFVQESEKLRIKIEYGKAIERIVKTGSGFEIMSQSNERYQAQQVLIATGGSPNPGFYSWITTLGHTIKSPLPSLFTFNDSQKKLSDLMGLSVKNAEVRIEGTKFVQQGPVLITHWGLSGPAVIKLSAWAAEFLYEQHYEFNVFVNWTGSVSETEIKKLFADHKASRPKQKVMPNPMFSIPTRLWVRLCSEAEISEEKVWSEIGNRNQNKLIESLIRFPFTMKGKTTFKEEFVTCGGVDLSEIDLKTMESKKMSNVFFAGEVLNIDGETGGFNFQSAWTTAFIAANAIAKKKPD